MLERFNLLNIFFSYTVIVAIYITVDGLRRLEILKGEYGRKAIHMSIGVLMAAQPIFMTRTGIAVFNSMFFIGIILMSGVFKFFSAYEDVQRWTIGQFLYPLSLLLIVFMYDDMRVYSFSVLMLALADGLAAVFGKWIGKHRYYIPGGYKTFEGSAAFFVVTVILLSIFVILEASITPYTVAVIIIGSMFLTGVEALIAAGFDNLAVPFFTALLLQSIV